MLFKHRIKRLCWLCFFLISSVDLQAQSIDKILDERLASDRNQSSIVVALVDQQGRRFFTSGKTSKKQNATAVNANTIFEIGSLTKVFTGILLAEAVRRDEVKLQDPISKHLPKNLRTPTYNGKEITLLNLIWHTSGLPMKPDNLNSRNPENPYADYTVARLYDFLSRYQLKHEPPSVFDYSKFEYSNLGVGLLGHILSLRANMPYEELIKTRILKPLGMYDTSITLTPNMRSRLAIGYNEDGEQTSNWDMPVLSGAGALRSTAADMAKFIAAHLGFKKTALDVSLAEARELGWSRGAIVAGQLVYNKTDLLFREGSTGGYVSLLAIDTKQRRGVFIATNSQDAISDIGFHIIDSSFPLRPIVPARKEITLSEKVLDQYVGEYQLADLGLVFTITREGRKLYLQQTGAARARLFAEKEAEFFFRVVDATITFVKDDNGRVTELVLHQKGDHIGKKVR